jgi:hypothetical protein
MWISIRTKRVNISPRMRRKIEDFLDRLFERERRYIGSIVISLRPATLNGEVGYACQITLWSHYLGLTVVSDRGDTIRTAVQQAALRSREVTRRRLHKRRSKTRRMTRGRQNRPLSRSALE